MIHELKCLPIYFDPTMNGLKTFEVRKNDRPFRVGDVLALNEFIPENPDPYDDTVYRQKTDEWREVDGGFYTGRCILKKISYILDDKELCAEGTVILGLSAYY